ncbi:MAG: gluconate 2-dehydrogenase subunit 3 family protein [Gemmatimonadaceae bacterium]
MTLTRRGFLASLASVVPLAAVVRRAHAAAAEHVQGDPATLDALAEVVLPAKALGKGGVANAAKAFRDWGAGYREGAELVHGYGTSRLRSTGPTPLTRWAKQLDDLAAAAQSAHRKPFKDLSVAERTTLVHAALEGQRLDRMPAVGDAKHVAVALLAHFYESADAADLCYESHIGKHQCRPLAASTKRPLPLLKVSER